MLERLKDILGRLRRPKSPTRNRVYGTIAAVLSVGVLWGVVTADDATQLTALAENLGDQYDKLLGILGALLAKGHVSPDDDKPDVKRSAAWN